MESRMGMGLEIRVTMKISYGGNVSRKRIHIEYHIIT